MRNYVDSCRTLEILKQDSGLLPKPREDWNVFEPAEGDIAHVDEGDRDYVFRDGAWEPLDEEPAE